MAKKQLSNFDSMWNEYPLGESAAVKKRIGGNVDADWITNTCVVRVSRAFNYSGHHIPNDRASLVTVRGGDRLRYAFRVAEFSRYLKAVYGAPSTTFAKGPTDEAPPDFLGKQGVIAFEVKGWSDATGHFDLWKGKKCINSDYFNRAHKVGLWEIPDSEDRVTAVRPAPMLHKIRGSVGRGGKNSATDVRLVQLLLSQRGYDPGLIDGVCGQETEDTIHTFQLRFLRHPDGRVDVDGRTWKELNGR